MYAVVTIVALILLFFLVLFWMADRQDRPTRKERRQRQLLDDAMALIFRLRHPTDLDAVDVLSDRSKEAADRLLARYRKETA